jgi:hypothetical protein
MGVKLLTQENLRRTEMRDLEDGQLAIVLHDSYEGTVVQRHGNAAIAIGKDRGYSWTDIENNKLLVRILDAGELIEVDSLNQTKW